MPEFHFIDDPNILATINSILDLAGPNFTAPYDSSSQPSDATKRNDESLTKMNGPGGTTLSPAANTSFLPNMSLVISSILSILAPFISAYGLILPIIGLLKGILEVLCCLMNPFCVIPAVERLLKKWVPAFLSLFPPIAGTALIMSVIKMILAIMYFIMTELIPTIQLLIKNIEAGIKAIEAKDLNRSAAIKQKLEALIKDLNNRLGITNLAKPVLEVIFIILRMFAGMPCNDDNLSFGTLLHLDSGAFPFDINAPDTNCCGDDMCPPVLKNPPAGNGVLVPSVYGDAPALWAWKLMPLSGHENIQELRPYMQNITSQLNPQLDEPIDEAVPAGFMHDAAHFRLRITGARGRVIGGQVVSSADTPIQDGAVLLPIARINADNSVIVTNAQLSNLQGVVKYSIETNFNQLIARNIIGIGCHPDIESAKQSVANRFKLGPSFLNNNPTMADIPDRYLDATDFTCLNELEQTIIEDPFSQDVINAAQECQDNLIDRSLGFVDFMIGRLNELLANVMDPLASSIDVDKNIVGAGTGKSIVTVTPRDVGGILLIKNLPSGVNIDVEIFTDFGLIQNQQANNTAGIVTAELTSPLAGIANVTAKVNGEFIKELSGTEEIVSTKRVKFVSDAVLPKRRLTTKSKARTGIGSEKDHGNR